MKGLEKMPDPAQLREAYERLQFAGRGRALPSSKDLALWSQWSRLDPRLAELLVQWLSERWEKIQPVELNRHIRVQPWPAAMGPLLEQGMPETALRQYRYWVKCVMAGVSRAADETYFVGLRAPGGRAIRRDATESLKAYRRWGYLSREVLRNKAAARAARTRLPRESRFRILEKLAGSRPRLSVAEYRAVVGEGLLTRRQAERDLAGHPAWKPRGATRGRFYVSVKPTSVRR